MKGEAAQSQRRSTLRSRRRAISKPFSDCTNTISQSQSSPPAFVEPKLYSQPKSKPDPADAAAGESAGDAADPPWPSYPPGDNENENVFEIHTHKQTADKGNARNKRKECVDFGLSEPLTVPLKKINFDGVERREPAVMESKAAQIQRRSTLGSSRSRTNREPLSDCTNTIFPSQAQSSPATVVATRPKQNPHPNPTTNSTDPSTPLPPSRPSPRGYGNEDCFKLHTIYTRRQTADERKGKEKALPVPFSSYSADKIVNARKEENESEDVGLQGPHTFPLKKSHGQDLLDYIQQQRAYFDDIDAFELPEEEVESE